MSAHINPYDEATMLAVVDDLENVLHMAVSGSTPARWEQLLRIAGEMRSNPPLIVHGPDGDAVERRKAALTSATTILTLSRARGGSGARHWTRRR